MNILVTGSSGWLGQHLVPRLKLGSHHVVGLDRASQIGFDTFIISALTPFSPDDCERLMEYAPIVVDRYFPRYREIYARRGWTMFDHIDRVCASTNAMRHLGFVCSTDFGDILAQLDREHSVATPAGRQM